MQRRLTTVDLIIDAAVRFPLHAFWLMRWGTPVVAILGSQIRFVAFWVTTSTLAAAGGLLCQSYLDKTRPSRIGRDDGVVRGFTRESLQDSRLCNLLLTSDLCSRQLLCSPWLDF